MHNTIKTLLSATLLLLASTSCDVDDVGVSLPPKTQDGSNTLGFLSNGEVWINYGEICNWGKCDANVVEGRLHTYPDGTKGVVVTAQHNNKNKGISQSFTLVVKNVTGAGTYTLDKKAGDYMGLIVDWSKNDFYENQEDSNAKLIVTRLDTINHIISGEFSGKLYNYNNVSLTREINEGRFDTKLTYSNY